MSDFVGGMGPPVPQQQRPVMQPTAYVSRHNTEQTKYTGPYAIVRYEGPKIKNNENGNMMMHTNVHEPVGRVLFANDATYEGGFKEDMMHGHGILIHPESGSKYDGQWVEDKREGFAVFEHPFGRYEGEYQNNVRQGHGKEIDTAGNTFEGEYLNGDAVIGKMNYANGDVYIGEVKEDERHGRGKFLCCETGQALEGYWESDNYMGPARVTLEECSS